MKSQIQITFVALLLALSSDAIAQDHPKFEVAGGYSYLNFHPGLSVITSQNLNGGGGAFVFNTHAIGIKADFMGYSLGTTGWTKKLMDAGYPVTGQASGNLFTYMFGPQIKMHHGRFQPFGEGLFGAAHSNGFAQILRCISVDNPTACQLSSTSTSGSSSNNSFAMEWGGGLDIKMAHHVQFRPVEVDYLYTEFHSNRLSNSQNSFKYFAGLNFTL
jgi:opacity protein-like surface antigen